MKPPKQVSFDQQRYLDNFLKVCPAAYKLRKLALQFRAMLRWRRSHCLQPWIEGPGFAVLVSWAVRPNPASRLARSRTVDHHAVEQRTTGRADQPLESHQTPDVRA